MDKTILVLLGHQSLGSGNIFEMICGDVEVTER